MENTMNIDIKGKSLWLTAAAAALATALAGGTASAQSLRFWTTEEQPDRLAKQQAMAAQFEAETGTQVEVIPISETDLGTRATAAFAAGDLPDVIYHPLQYALPWAEAGILDTDAATEVVDELGVGTFASGALDMAAVEDGYASVPVDGWTQMIVYRKDLFDANGLAAPSSYSNVVAALEALHNPPDMYGFVAATKVDENFMSQVLEHVFLANGVTPVDDSGFKPLDEAKTIEVLEFYKAVADASPDGELYWKQSRELYFAGKAAMIIWSPFILDELAGLRDSAPPTINDDPTSSELASLTGIVTNFAGPSNPEGAAWGDVRYFGITLRRGHRRSDGIRDVLDGRRLHPDSFDSPGGQVPGTPRHHGRHDDVRRRLVEIAGGCRPEGAAFRAVRAGNDRRNSRRAQCGEALGR